MAERQLTAAERQGIAAEKKRLAVKRRHSVEHALLDDGKTGAHVERTHLPEAVVAFWREVRKASAEDVDAVNEVLKINMDRSALPDIPTEELEKEILESLRSISERSVLAGDPSEELVEKKNTLGAITSDLPEILDLLGGFEILERPIKSDLDAHELLHRGLPRGALASLIGKLHGIPVMEASEALGMSLRTLQRHKSEPDALLDAQQSGRTWMFAKILAKATRVLGSQDEAEQWLRRPAIGLNQRRPVDLLTTPAGVKLVEDYLERLEYNVYT
jgi:putative toxin-antitoxin system antitoxin component (TIGR02293 family)